MDGIGKKIGKLAIADLEKAGADPDARVRRTAIRWLGQLKDTDAVVVRVQAAAALAMLSRR